MVEFPIGHAPWEDLPADPEDRLRELRRRLNVWRRLLPCDYSGVTAILREMMGEVLKQRPELRRRRRR